MEKWFWDNIEYTGLFLAIILSTVVLAFLVNRLFRRLIRKSTDILKNDPTNYLFLRHAIVGIIYLVGFGLAVYAMPNLRGLAGSLLAGAGILAVAIGFASQHALSNIISGVFIVIFKPFRVNDRLQVKGMEGAVEDITLRHTVIRNFENRRIIIPNAVISDEVIVNADFGDGRICKWVNLSIDLSSDIDQAKTIMREEVMAHPFHIDIRTPEQIEAEQPPVNVRVISITETGIHLRAWAWAKDNADAFALGCDVLETIKKRFDEAGISMAVPYRKMIYPNEEAK